MIRIPNVDLDQADHPRDTRDDRKFGENAECWIHYEGAIGNRK